MLDPIRPNPNPDPNLWRPVFHLAPPEGLINDPNGLIHWKGQHHVFFQWNPTGCSHENKSWGHRRSADLVTWVTLPIALAPNEWFESRGCYSGSAVADGDDLLLFYTGNVRDAAGARQTRQCLARSRDGIAFEKLGPVIDGPLPGYTTHFRDPKVWREGDKWQMVIGAQTEALQGTVVLLAADDPANWRQVGPILEAGQHGYMCECPDLFTLGGADLLIFCQQHQVAPGEPSGNVAGWVAGRLDRASAAYDHGAFHRLDHGRDFYAPQSWQAADGRRLMLAWMGLPEQETAPTVAQGWFHCLTMPRELVFEDGVLKQRPVAELAALRGPLSAFSALKVEGVRELAPRTGSAFECEILLDPAETTDLAIDLRAGALEATTLSFKRASGLITLETRDATGAVTLLGKAEVDVGIDRVHAFVDRSSVEIFIGDGRIVFSARIFPGDDAEALRLCSHAGANIPGARLWPLIQI